MTNQPTFPTTAPVDTPERVAQVWGSSRQPAGCPACKGVYLVRPDQPYPPCPTCAAASLEPQPALLRFEPPELLAPPRLGRAELNNVLAGFVRGVWLHPADFSVESLASRLKLVYWPMWLVDAGVSGEWQAEAGFDYHVQSSQESYQGGGWHSTERVETRVRWEPRLGQIERRYDNLPLPALQEHNALQDRLGRYRLEESGAYTSEQIQPAVVRLPDVHPENAWPEARARLDQAAAADCTEAAGAQHIRNFSIRASYASPNWSLLLLPMYTTYYTDDDGRRRPVYINAQTGQAGGLRMASQRQGWIWGGVLAAVAVGLFLLALLGFAAAVIFPPGAAVGGLLVILAALVLLAAAVPIIWPWQWNNRQML